MKKLILFIAIAFSSCDNKDEVPYAVQQGSVKIISYDFNYIENRRYNFEATVKNETDEFQSGKVRFSIASGNATVYTYINNVSIAPNETDSFNQLSDVMFDEVPEVDGVEFIK